MIVTFICNQFPENIGKYFQKNDETSGGWITGYLNKIKNDVSVNYILIEKSSINKEESYFIDQVKYQMIHYSNISYLMEIICKSDVYHVFGFEFSFLEDLLKVIPKDRLVVSIQGIISECALNYYASYKKFEKTNFCFDMYMCYMKYLMRKRGLKETKYIKETTNVIGRTNFDYKTVKKINKNINYYKCNETVRDVFYEGKWNFSCKEKKTIFVTQASYSIKGAHLIIEIANRLKTENIDFKIIIGGEDLTKVDTILARLRINYAGYIQKLIKKYNLYDNIVFVGPLTGIQVKQHMLDCDCFLLSSSMENSPNSMAEAMLLGVPCVCSNVGGVTDFTNDGYDALLYEYEDLDHAVLLLKKVLFNQTYSEEISKNAYLNSRKYYDGIVNAKTLLEIYSMILKKSR